MRRRMAEAEVGDDVYGEDPTVLALEERVAGLFGHEAALFTPTGSMANVLARRGAGRPGQEVLCETRAHIAARRARRPRRFTGITTRTWAARGLVDLDAIRGDDAPDMGPFFVSTAAVSSRTPTTSAAARCSRSATWSGCARSPTRAAARCTRRRPALERPRRHRHAAGGVRRGRRHRWRSACPRGSVRRSGRCARLGRADRRRAGLAQAARRRDAPGRRPRRCRAARPRPPRRPAGRRPRARAAAGRGVSAATRP